MTDIKYEVEVNYIPGGDDWRVSRVDFNTREEAKQVVSNLKNVMEDQDTRFRIVKVIRTVVESD